MTQSELSALLTSLIRNWENEVVEFKTANDSFSTDEIGRYFSALSNEANLRKIQNGWLVFGVHNKSREIIGTDYRQDPVRLNSLKMQIHEGTGSTLSFRKIHILEHPNGRVLLFEIPAAPQGIPAAWKGHYYARAGESLVALNLDKLEFIRREGQTLDWSAQVVPDATYCDLDEKALEKARENFRLKHANRFTPEEVNAWPLDVFLDRAKVTRGGKITRTTLLLLGKSTSAHLLNPHPAQLTWKLVGEERAYEHFGPPFLLNSTRLFKRIRNIQIRVVPCNSLLATEVAKYDRKVILEALHNCIAHQDYTLNSRIIVTEYIDRLLLFNAGSFFEGDVGDYISGEKTPSRYRNPMLATAMAELNMIDTMGYGIHDMFTNQIKRGFPLLDYDVTSDSVSVTIYGHIIDESYTSALLQKTDLTLDKIILLDRIQKNLDVSAEALGMLRKAKLIEGRKPNIRISPMLTHVSSLKIKEQALLTEGAQAEGAQAEGAQAEGAQVELGKSTLCQEILKSLSRSVLTKSQLAAERNVTIRTGSFVRALTLLRELGLIESTHEKPRSPNQAYRITEKGWDFLKGRQ